MTRQLRFETMEERLYLSVSPISSVQEEPCVPNAAAETMGTIVPLSAINADFLIPMERVDAVQVRPTVSVRVVPEQTNDEKIVFEIERKVDPNDPHAIDEPLEVLYEAGIDAPGLGRIAMLLPPDILLFQPGQSKVPLELTSTHPNSWAEIKIWQRDEGITFLNRYFEPADSFFEYPERLTSDSSNYHIEQERVKVYFGLPIPEAVMPSVNVKTVQDAVVFPDGQVQQGIIFEFERIIGPASPGDLDQALTIEYELRLDHVYDSKLSNSVASLLNKPLSLTFQPGETSVRLEFSELGCDEYNDDTRLIVYLLGTYGEDATLTSDSASASAKVSLVNKPGEQCVPEINVRVVPELTYDDRVVFEFERTVDPKIPHALDESLEIFYVSRGGEYTIIDGRETSIPYMFCISPQTLVFQPGQTKALLELTGKPDQWVSVEICRPGYKDRIDKILGSVVPCSDQADESPVASNVSDLVDERSTYIVGQEGKAESDFGRPCPQAETTPTVFAMVVQNGIINDAGITMRNMVLEFERVFHASDSDSINEPLTVNFAFQRHYYRQHWTVMDRCTVVFQPGETKVRFEYDPGNLEDTEFELIRGLVCTLETPKIDTTSGKSQHYHVGTAEVNIDIEGTDAEFPEEFGETEPFRPNLAISGPEVIQAKRFTYWEFESIDSSSPAIMNWTISWGDGSKDTCFRGGPRNRVIPVHYYTNPGQYNIRITVTSLWNGSYAINYPITVEETPIVSDTVLPITTYSSEESDTTTASSFSLWDDSESAIVKTPSVLGIAEIDMFYRLEESGDGCVAFSDFAVAGSVWETEFLCRTASDFALADWDASAPWFNWNKSPLDK